MEQFMDELFDGWLSAPSIAGFLAEDSSPSSSGQSPKSTVEKGLAQVDIDGHSRLHVDRNGQCESLISNRKGNRKSRLGCINCKKRKIKCQETWPSCANCARRGFTCRYPKVLQPMYQENVHARVASRALHSLRPSDTPSFSSTDMRLFHYYLTTAYPVIPDDMDNFWIKDIALLSHNYSYLMHSILAMSASHMTALSDDSQINTALLHRQKAISGLEEAFTRWSTAEDQEVHVMFAASSLLATQASFMPDAFLDSILAMRGCSLIMQAILSNQLKGLFLIPPEFRSIGLEHAFMDFPQVDQKLAQETLYSIADYAPLLSSPILHGIERDLTAQIAETVRQLFEYPAESFVSPGSTTEGTLSTQSSPPPENKYLKSPLVPYEISPSFEEIPWETIASIPPASAPNPRRSFEAAMAIHLILFTWPPDELLRLFSPSNKIGAIVLAHLLAVCCIIAPLSAPSETAVRILVKTPIDWLDQIIDGAVDDSEVKWSRYMEWPKKILKCLKCCVKQKRALNYHDLVDIVVNDPGALREGRARRGMVG